MVSIITNLVFTGNTSYNLLMNVGIFFGNDTSRYSSTTFMQYLQQSIVTHYGWAWLILYNFVVGTNYQ